MRTFIQRPVAAVVRRQCRHHARRGDFDSLFAAYAPRRLQPALQRASWYVSGEERLQGQGLLSKFFAAERFVYPQHQSRCSNLPGG